MPPAHPTADSDPAAISAVIAAAQRTLGESSARLAYEHSISWEMPDRSREMKHSPLWLKGTVVAGKLAWKITKGLWRLLPTEQSFSSQSAEGIIEPSRLRYMLDFGSFAELYDHGELFAGRSGRSLRTLTPWSSDTKNPDVLWLLSLLSGTVQATASGSTEILGVVCTELEVRADLSVAASKTDFPLKAPPRADFNDLRSLEVTVWIDDQHVRRVRYREQQAHAQTSMSFDFCDFGTDTTALDWTRLPNHAT